MQAMLNTNSTMKSFCIFGVFLLMSVAESKAGTSDSVSPRSCKSRNLTFIVDNYIVRFYFDGIELTYLRNITMVTLDFPCTTKLIAIHGSNYPNHTLAGIRASTDDGYVLTNSSWKCSNVSQIGWETTDFDDSAWKPAIEYYGNPECYGWGPVPGMHPNAAWIWLRQWNCQANTTYEEMDQVLYCRKNIDACNSSPCLNDGICNNLGSESFTCTCPIYATGVTCESPNYNEAFACGTALTWSQYDASNGFTRLCYFWTHVDDTEGRFNPCRNTIKGIPLYDDANGLLNAGGNFGCVVSQNYPDDIPATSYLSCADNFQQDVYLGNVSETDRLMVCIRYPYEGVPGRK